MSRHSIIGFLAAVAAAVALTSPPASAQSLWMPREFDRTLSLEMLRPQLEGVDAGFLSAAFFLSGRLAISEHLAIVGEVPYVSHKSTQLGTDINGNVITVELSSSSIGDSYVGMETQAGTIPIFAELGVRIPLADEDEPDALLSGYFADVVRQDAFLPKIVSIHAAFNLREVTPSKIAYRLRLSPVLALRTEGGDPELFAVYSFQIGYHGSQARVGSGMSGRALITEDFGNLGTRTLNQFEIHADFLSGSFRPGLDLRLPLGEISQLVPVALGASISYTK